MHTPFKFEHIYDSPIEKVWEALTQTVHMKKWYFSQLMEFEPVLGFTFTFKDDGSAYKKEWVVTDVVHEQKLSHTWVYKGYPGISEVTFQLYKEGDKTRLKLTHTALETFPDDPHFARERFENGWATILGTDLKNFLGNNT